MTYEPAETGSAERRTRIRAIVAECAAGLAMLAVLVFYAVVQIRNFTPGTVEPDCEGYFILGKRLASGEAPGRTDEDPLLHASHVWVRNARGETLPKYAPGYPLLVGIAYRLGGDRAAFAVNPVLGALAVLGAFFLYREWMPRGPAVVAAALLSLHPMVIAYAGYPLAHAAELAFATWGFYALWRWKRRGGIGAGIGAGVLLGLAAAARPATLLFGLALAAAAVDTFLRAPRPRRRALLAAAIPAAAWALAVLPLALYQWRWFGHPFATGYALSGEQQSLVGAHALRNAPTLWSAFVVDLAPGWFPLAFFGLLLPGPAWERAARALWLAPLALLHLFYYWAPPGWVFSRFLLGTLPLLVGAAAALPWRVPAPAAVRALAFALFAALAATPSVARLRAESWAGRGIATRARAWAEAADAVAACLREDAALFLAAPFDRGFAARGRYTSYPLAAFQPGYAERAMPEPGPDGPSRAHLVLVQPERREALLDLQRELGPEGLAQRRIETVAALLREGRPVGFLLPGGPRPIRDLAGPGTLTPIRAVFDTAAGRWTLYEAELPPEPDPPPG